MNNGEEKAGKDKIYSTIKLRITLCGLALDFILISLLAFSGISSLIADTARIWNTPYADFLVFIFIAGALFSAAAFPLDFYSSYIVEHRFGLSNQSPGKWVTEKFKSSAVSMVIMVPLALLFYFFLRSTGQMWWFWFALALFFVTVLLAAAAPVIIMPLFYRFTELEEGDVKETVSRMAEKAGIEVRGVFRFDMSRNTKKANAGFTGLGRSRRIVLSDTLLENFTPREIAVVFAHEAGHYRLGHIRKNIVLSAVIIFSVFFLCSAAYSASAEAMGFAHISDLEALPLLVFFLTIAGFFLMPLTNFISRRFEVQADRYALELTGDRESFIGAMDRLAEVNLADRDPNPYAEFFLHSHPSIKKRTEMAEKWG